MLPVGSCGFLGGGRVDRLEAGDPSQIGSFRLLGRLGEGGMGRVYLGESPGGRKVAIKVVHPLYAKDPEFRSRFAREEAAARRVGGFHTAQVVAADPNADPPWMATAYIPGPSLAAAIAQQGPLDEAGVRKLGAALAEGLAAIHACGIIHRDLKPGNVILADDGPRIIDFGIAKSANSTSLTAPDAVIGTLHYMSPEQLSGQRLTKQSDIFALGAILAYAATGHDPFDASNILRLHAQILNGRPDLDPLTGDLRDIISACLAREPGDRPSTADLLARFNPPKTPRESTVIGTAGPVPAVLPPTETLRVRAKPERAAVGKSPAVGMVNVGPDVPPQAKPPTAPTLVARRTARKPRHRRRPAILAACAVAAAGLAGLSVFLLGKHPATASSATGSLALSLSDPTSLTASSVAFGPDETLATGDRSGRTYLWNTTTGKRAAIFTGPASRGGVFSVAFGPDGILATGDNNGRTDLWNTTARKHAATLSDISNQVVPSLAFGPDHILATDQVKSTDLWNTTTGKITATLTDPASGGVFSLSFGPGGTLATGDHNGHAYLWNTTTGKITATLTDPASTGVNSLAFGPGATLATGDNNGHAYLWNTTTGKITATLTDPASTGVNSVAFGPGGTVLAAGDHNGSTYLWNITYH